MSDPTAQDGAKSPESAASSDGRSSDEFFLVDVPPSAYHQTPLVQPAQTSPPQEGEPSLLSKSSKKKKPPTKSVEDDNGQGDENDDTSEITRILANPSPTDGPSAFASDDYEHKSLIVSEDINLSSGSMDRLPERRGSDDFKEAMFSESEPPCRDHPLSRVLLMVGLLVAVGVAFSWYRGSAGLTPPVPDFVQNVPTYADGTVILPQCYANAIQGQIIAHVLKETAGLFDYNMSHPEECCTTCMKLEMCVAYSFENSTNQRDSGRCYLHSSVGEIETTQSDNSQWFHVLLDGVTTMPATTIEATTTAATEAPKENIPEDMRPLRNRIAMLIPYLSSGFPKYVRSLVLPTLRKNADLVDWIIIADNGTDFGESHENIIVHYLPDNGVRKMMHEWTFENLDLNLTKDGQGFWGWRYKTVDFKPMLGSIFKEWIPEEKYSHWGYCDLDVVYGKLSLFVTQEMLDEYDAMAMLDVRRTAWMMNGPFSLYRNNEYGREHWTFIQKDLLVRDLSNSGITSIDEHISSPPIISDAHASFAFIFSAVQPNWVNYPNWTVSWDETDGHLLWRPDPDMSDAEKNVKEGPITDIKPNHALQARMSEDSVLQWVNGMPWVDRNPSTGFNYYVRSRLNETAGTGNMTWYARRIDHDTVFRNDLGAAVYELSFCHFYRIGLGREFEYAAKKMDVNLTTSVPPAKSWTILWNGLDRGHNKPKPAFDVSFSELDFTELDASGDDGGGSS